MREQCKVVINVDGDDTTSAIIERNDSVVIVGFKDNTITVSKYLYPIEPHPIFTTVYHSLGDALIDRKLDNIICWVVRGVIGVPK